jgi:hypothetical protein
MPASERAPSCPRRITALTHTIEKSLPVTGPSAEPIFRSIHFEQAEVALIENFGTSSGELMEDRAQLALQRSDQALFVPPFLVFSAARAPDELLQQHFSRRQDGEHGQRRPCLRDSLHGGVVLVALEAAGKDAHDVVMDYETRAALAADYVRVRCRSCVAKSSPPAADRWR